MDGDQHAEDREEQEQQVDDQDPVLDEERRDDLRRVLGTLEVEPAQSGRDDDGNHRGDDGGDDQQRQHHHLAEAKQDHRPVGQGVLEPAADGVDDGAFQIFFRR